MVNLNSCNFRPTGQYTYSTAKGSHGIAARLKKRRDDLHCRQKLEHDPEKWMPVFRKIMLKQRIKGMRRFNLIAPCPKLPNPEEKKMTHVTYHIVEHDGGWAYKLGDVFSETFRTRDAAIQAARNAAMEQQIPGQTSGIRYEDGSGKWHEEIAEGDDRPEADVSTTD